MNEQEFSVKIGDKVIADDRFHNFGGFIDGEIIEITPYKEKRGYSNAPNLDDNKFGVTILGRFKKRDLVSDKEYEYTRRIYSCDFKVNPKVDVSVDWSNYDTYAKALFFTSQKIKNDFNDMIRNKNMEYHLSMAKRYGYVENK